MTFQRDLALQNLDMVYKTSIANQFARYALALNFELLPKEVVYQAKRCVLDALGCAIGAYNADGRPICEEVIRELGGTEDATVFASGLRTSVLNATLINSFLVRYLDFNDFGGGGHNSDSVPGILAVAEREKSNGRDFITSLVISYELGTRFRDALPGGQLPRGLNPDLRGSLNMPPALGKLMRLNEDQIANAIGICASGSLPLNILNAGDEAYNMRKNLRFGMVAYDAVLACMLAKKGFTGPIRIVEGEQGLQDGVFQNTLDLKRMVEFSGWRIMMSRFKFLPVCGALSAMVQAILEIVKEQDLKSQDIASVHVNSPTKALVFCGTLAKKYPRDKETADHSSYFTAAIAIRDRVVDIESYKPENFTDPVVLDLIEKITVDPGPTAGEDATTAGRTRGSRASAEITTTDGRKFEKSISSPRGFGDKPATDAELEGKFKKMAAKYMSKQQMQKIIDTVWNLENLKEMGKLASLMAIPSIKRKERRPTH
jgi:2-methylcitrate dehydratase